MKPVEDTSSVLDAIVVYYIFTYLACRELVYRHALNEKKTVSFREIRSKNKDSTVCRICDATLKYNGNTTNMAKHIDMHHV
jgi:hypothetical protein